MTWKANLEVKDWAFSANLRVWRAYPDRIDMVKPLQFKTYDRGVAVPDNEITLGGRFHDDDTARDFLQAMVDLAWKHGIGPQQLQDHTNELKAVRDHLADMQRLVFHKPIIAGPDMLSEFRSV